MLSSAVALVKTPPLCNRRPSPVFTLNFKHSNLPFNRNSFTLNNITMLAGSFDTDHITPAPSAFEQEAAAFIQNQNPNENDCVSPGRLHAMVNLMSKWIVAVSFGGFLFLRRDALALWAAMGSVINMIISVTLKHILKQERPVSRASSGHGMPSSHAQAIFYTILCIILSLVELLGFGGVTAIVSMFVVAIGSYFSWLRVSQRYHTAIQVIVGAIVGSVFAVVWFWAWEAVVYRAYESSLTVRVIVTVGAIGFTLGFISHVIRHWLKGED